MRRRKRGSRYTWMPMLGTTYPAEGPGYQSNIIRFFLQPETDNALQPTQAGATPSLVIAALVPDYTEEPDPNQGVAFTLRDYTEGQDWFLRRLVGKIHVSCCALNSDQNQVDSWPAVLVTVGFFVARSRDDAEGTIDIADAEGDPQHLQNIRQPWLWRRTWILGAAQTAFTPPGIELSALWPNSNSEYGSIQDGPHIDAKTMRRIRREQRLWMAVSVLGTGFPGAETAVGGIRINQPLVSVYTDVRALGAMRRSTNKSAF